MICFDSLRLTSDAVLSLSQAKASVNGPGAHHPIADKTVPISDSFSDLVHMVRCTLASFFGLGIKYGAMGELCSKDLGLAATLGLVTCS